MPLPAALPEKPSRIDLIDALRGSALLGIFLLHCIEHFEFSQYPPDPPAWLASLNQQTKDTLFFLFGGKAYAIFAMMFGVSFSLIIDSAARKGLDFRARFVWRLFLLGAGGYLFGLLYCGEILTMLAVLGLPLVFLHKAPDRLLLWLSALLLLQLPFLYQLLRSFADPAYQPLRLGVGAYYREMYQVFGHEGFLEVVKVNAWTSILGRSAWAIENGRYLQMFGLFLWGIVLARARFFENPDASSRLARRALIVALIAAVALYVARAGLPSLDASKVQQGILKKLLTSWLALAQMVVWAAGFILLYQLPRVQKLLRLLIPFGRTSLTCYVLQNALGVLLFYHFGAGLFRHWGQFYSLLFGLAVFAVQLPLMHVWLRHFHYGPLEWLWRCLTQLSFKTPFRKRDQPSSVPA
ncbi:hypothetical protein CMV30_09745 [Nibricoccus aquaticus]|uniref:DUF418 domain-containing protein n=1 Tax=Nibricoccus aquaticus TaxID=2576891 RepID=A0A290QD86_9BACT|nr:DUF418 domain-containing protein [Nibricoccus aquaticus]ATC64216.1 hypothetical protein CMV30_09745 [Nibricoccus aquaticus]